MISSDIPFEQIGIEQVVGLQIIDALNSFMLKYPQKNIDIQKISDNTGYTRAMVKYILYILLGLRHLKATFVPIHSTCGCVIGQQECSASAIEKGIEKEEYFCIRCREVIYRSQEVQTQILFWEPGTNVR